ncbi:MAG: TolC family protein [Prevotellaceae bacterium]|nr:TolC family protein [Prevotellaceae bacterium]
MKRLLYVIWGMAFQVNATAQDSLTLDRCREMAVEHNRQLASARVQREKSEHDLTAMRANFMPKLDFHAFDLANTMSGNLTTPSGTLPIFSYNPGAAQFLPSLLTDAAGNVVGLSQYAEFPAMTVNYSMHNLFSTGLSLTQPIYMGGKISTGYKMTKIGKRIAEENIRLTKSEVTVKVDEAYALAVKACEMVDVAQYYEQLLQELKKNVESAVRHGMRTRNDAMKVQVKLNQARLSITRANNALDLALMNLCQVVGLPLDSRPLVAKPDVTSAVMDEMLTASADSSLVVSRPEYAMLQDKTELARQQVKLTRADFLPQIAAFASGGYSYGGKVSVDATSTVAGTHNMYDKTLVDKFSGAVGVTLSVPIFHFGERRGKIRSAKAALRMAQLELDDNRELMALELSQAYNTLKEQMEALEIARLSVEQATENLRLSRSAYDSGVETLSDHLEAQALWQSALADEIDARAQLLVALSKWRKAAGR